MSFLATAANPAGETQTWGTGAATKTFRIQPGRLEWPVYIALSALGYRDLCRRTVLKGRAGSAVVAARLRIDYGDSALSMFNLWGYYQALLSNLNHTAQYGGGIVSNLVDLIETATIELGIATSVVDALGDIRSLIAGRRISRRRAQAARQLLVGPIQTNLSAQIGLDERLRTDSVEHSRLTYPLLYRYCTLLGKFRALYFLHTVVPQSDTRTGYERLQQHYELLTIIERLGISAWVPIPARAVANDIKNLHKGKPPVSHDYSALWNWIGDYLDIIYGGLTLYVYSLSHHIELFALMANSDNRPIQLMKEIAEDIDEDAKALDIDSYRSTITSTFEDEFARLIESTSSDPLHELCNRVASWLNDIVPRESRHALTQTRIDIWVDKFSSFWIPIDAERIASFIDQFPRGMDWVAEGLLDAVDYYDQRFFSTSLSSVIGRWLDESAALCLLGGARKSSSVMSYVIDRKLRLPYYELREVLETSNSTKTIIFVDDCMLSGTQAIHILSELLGIWHRRHKYHSMPLTKHQIDAFRTHRVVFLSAIGTNWAAWRLHKFLREQHVRHEIEFARMIPCLSTPIRNYGDVFLTAGQAAR